jgi:uncharacterized protein YdhG (YjbR/CyaY superfamily)
MVAAGTVDEYMAALPDDRRAVLEELRQTIRAAAPGAKETIAYRMPAFTSHGRLLVSFAAYKLHYRCTRAAGPIASGGKWLPRPGTRGRRALVL